VTGTIQRSVPSNGCANWRPARSHLEQPSPGVRAFPGLLRALIRDAGMTVEEFIEALRR
jgi:hypothetical protein